MFFFHAFDLTNTTPNHLHKLVLDTAEQPRLATGQFAAICSANCGL